MKRVSRLASFGLAFVLIKGVVESVDGQTAVPDKALAALQDKILSKGPNGEEPSPANSVSLSDAEVEEIRELKAKAAIVMRYSRNDWSAAQVAGLKSQFGKMGIDVIAVTDAGKPSRCMEDCLPYRGAKQHSEQDEIVVF